MASVIEQDPVREEEERKEMKPVVSIRVARRLAQEHYALTEPTLFARLLHLFFDRKRTKISALNSYDDKNFLFYEFSCEFHRDVCRIQYENELLLCTITFSFSKL